MKQFVFVILSALILFACDSEAEKKEATQFFICHSRNNTSHLDRKHTCFGKVIEGLDVIDQIREGDVIQSIKIIED